MNKNITLQTFSLLILLLGAACSAVAAPVSPTAINLAVKNIPTPPGEPAPANTTAAAAAQPTLPPLEPTPAVVPICPPLAGYSLSELTESISSPFLPPPSGSDDPHQGIDFAVAQDGIALQGHPAQAVLAGRVAAVIRDRFPYGNALLVETPLSALPANSLALPQAGAALQVRSALTCPAAGFPWLANQGQSLYLLYAHLLETPQFNPGDNVACGQQIGQVGESGNALNPHLHLEARLGPADASFSSMAHYDPSATVEEMAGYCAWRVSGYFPLLDPMALLAKLPGE